MSMFGKPTTAHARRSDPATSHEAARKMRFSNAEHIVYNVLRETGVPMTSLCIARYLQDNKQKYGDTIPWTVSPRLKPLERKGWVERHGRKHILNSSNRPAHLTAWRIRPQNGGAPTAALSANPYDRLAALLAVKANYKTLAALAADEIERLRAIKR